MPDNRNQPILVTGSHRSGSTWVGRMLALDPSIGFIMEPFNLHHRPGICRARFDFWFQYLCESNGESFEAPVRDCLEFRYSLGAELRSIRSPKDLGRMTRDLWIFTNNRLHGRRALQKDPIALFSADWLAGRFDMDVVVLVRHPAAFAGSLKSADWQFPFTHLLEQDLLMEHRLSAFRADVEQQARSPGDIIDQAILLWNVTHHVIRQYESEYDSWHFIKHEDLSSHPVSGYRGLYADLGLNYSPQVEAQILKHSSAERPDGLKRDSKSNISTWKSRLTAEEIDRVRSGTLELAPYFYNEETWS